VLLQRRYGNSQQHEKFKLELKSRRRKPDEDIQSLAQEIERLVCHAYPRAPADLRETLSLGSFIDALDDPYLQCRLREREPFTLNEAVAAALRLEAIAVSTLRGEDPPRRYTRAAKSDEPEPRKKDRQERPTPPSASGKSSPPKRERNSPRKAPTVSAREHRDLQGQLRRQDSEINRLRRKVVDMDRASSAASTPVKSPTLSLLNQGAELQLPYFNASSTTGELPATAYQQAACYATPSVPATPLLAGSRIPTQPPTPLPSVPPWLSDSVPGPAFQPTRPEMDIEYVSQRPPQVPVHSLVSSPAQTPSAGRRNPPGLVVCYNCIEVGHIQRACPLRVSDVNRYRNQRQDPPRSPVHMRAVCSEL